MIVSAQSRLFMAVLTTFLFSVAFGYGQITPIVIQKDSSGHITPPSAVKLAQALEEIQEHGTLRVWIEANFKHRQLEPGDAGYEAQLRRMRVVQQRVVATLASAAPDVHPEEILQSEGPFLIVTTGVTGARALVANSDVRAFVVLAPSY